MRHSIDRKPIASSNWLKIPVPNLEGYFIKRMPHKYGLLPEQLSFVLPETLSVWLQTMGQADQKVASAFILEASPRAHPANLSFRIDSFKFRRYMSGKCRKYGAHIKIDVHGLRFVSCQCFFCVSSHSLGRNFCQ